jgi:hypothetical protein
MLVIITVQCETYVAGPRTLAAVLPVHESEQVESHYSSSDHPELVTLQSFCSASLTRLHLSTENCVTWVNMEMNVVIDYFLICPIWSERNSAGLNSV